MSRYTVRDITDEINTNGKNEKTSNLPSAKDVWQSGTFEEMMTECSFFGILVAPPLVLTYNNGVETKVAKIKLLFRQNFVNLHTLNNRFVAASCPNRVFSYNVYFRMQQFLTIDGSRSFLNFTVRPSKFPIGRALFANGQVWIFEERDICNVVPIWPMAVPSMEPFIPLPYNA